MDNLTHGLFGLAVGALRRPSLRGTRALDATDRAVLLTCVIAAELPDIDTLWPAGDDVLHALLAHRGPTHSLLAAPVVALFAAAIAQVVFRGARFGVSLRWGTASVVFAHLIADAWTGWGTRLLLPFSNERVTWDWTLVVDPLVTLPLLVGLIWAARRRDVWRRAVLIGAACACAYVGVRVAIRAVLISQVRTQFASSERVEVFPAWFSLLQWRFVAVTPTTYEAGTVKLAAQAKVQRSVPRTPPALPACVSDTPSIREALAWARLPVVQMTELPDGARTITVSDLRYHLGGEPTLGFKFELAADCSLRQARMERGGSARDILRRMREADEG